MPTPINLADLARRALDALGNPRLQSVAQVLEESRPYEQTERTRLMEIADSYYRGTQHDGKKVWWDGRPYLDRLHRMPMVAGGSAVQPMDDPPPWYHCRPFVRYLLAQAIVDRFTGLLFSRTRLPRLVPTLPGDADAQPWIDAVLKRMGWWRGWRKARTMGGATGTVVVGVKLRAGVPVLEVFAGQHCTPVWLNDDPETGVLIGLEVLYQREVGRYKPVKDRLGQETGNLRWVQEREWYRRIITPELDVAMACPENPEDAATQGWTMLGDPVQHGLGFVPYVWIRNSDDDPTAMDGRPDVAEVLWDDLDALDATLSDAFMGTHYNADPTVMIKTARQKGDVRTGSGRTIWLDPGDDAALLELAGTGGQAAAERAIEIRHTVLGASRCMLEVRPTGAKGQATATEVEELAAPMYERADELREIYGAAQQQVFGFLLRILAAQGPGALEAGLRPRVAIVAEPEPEPEPEDQGLMGAAAQAVKRRKAAKAPKVLAPAYVIPTGGVDTVWPPYFDLKPEGQAARVKMFVDARTARLVTVRTAVQSLADTLGIKDPEAEADALEDEDAATAQQMLDAAMRGTQGQGASEDDQDQQAQEPAEPQDQGSAAAGAEGGD